MQRLNQNAGYPSLARPLLSKADKLISHMQDQVEKTEKSVHALYDDLISEANEMDCAIEQIEVAIDQLEAASFQLPSTEGLVMAVEAVWVKNGKETHTDPKGVLFLTDLRLLFEQKQEVATKKVLFVTTEKKIIQQLALEMPVALIGEAKSSKQGLLGHEDHIEVTFSPGAPLETAHFHINGQDSDEWKAMIERALSRDYDRERITPVDCKQ